MTESQTLIEEFVALHNYHHSEAKQTTETEITNLIKDWFENVFNPAIAWYTMESQPDILKSITATYLSDYVYMPLHFQSMVHPRPNELILPSTRTIVNTPNEPLYRHLVHSRIGTVVIKYLYDFLACDIKEGISQDIARNYSEEALLPEREMMLGVNNAENTSTVISRCCEYMKLVLQNVYTNAVQQLP